MSLVNGEWMQLRSADDRCNNRDGVDIDNRNLIRGQQARRGSTTDVRSLSPAPMSDDCHRRRRREIASPAPIQVNVNIALAIDSELLQTTVTDDSFRMPSESQSTKDRILHPKKDNAGVYQTDRRLPTISEIYEARGPKSRKHSVTTVRPAEHPLKTSLGDPCWDPLCEGPLKTLEF
ncbi:hypothetical protein J6590_106659 [Homalodisca vitripennis]|nr:hypothetical protein J6590_106659 [Homalodisca vitripennis]